MHTPTARRSFLAAGLFICSLAHAHAYWVSPAPRVQKALKTGPCGGVSRTASAVTYEPGATVHVTWTETIAHPGWYRVAFSSGADNDFDSTILKDNILNPSGVQALDGTDVTLPMTPCNACTLQLIQVMTESQPYSNYYSCADIKLVQKPVGDSGTADEDAGTGGDDAGDPGQEWPDGGWPTDPTGGTDAGLSTSPSAGIRGGCTSSVSGAMLLGVGLVLARRRPR